MRRRWGGARRRDPAHREARHAPHPTRPLFAHHVAASEELQARVPDLLGWVAEGWLRVDVRRTLSLADAAEAHRELEAYRAVETRETGGKLLLIP